MTVMQNLVPEPAENRGASEIAAAKRAAQCKPTQPGQRVGSEQLPRVVRTDCRRLTVGGQASKRQTQPHSWLIVLVSPSRRGAGIKESCVGEEEKNINCGQMRGRGEGEAKSGLGWIVGRENAEI